MRYIVIPETGLFNFNAGLYERSEGTKNNPADPLAPRYHKTASGHITDMLNIAKQLNGLDQPTCKTNPDTGSSTGPHLHFTAEPTPPATSHNDCDCTEPCHHPEQEAPPAPKPKQENPMPGRKHRKGSEDIDAKVAELRKKPGEWERIKQVSSSAARNSWTRRGCEARTGKENGELWLYARWPQAESIVPAVLKRIEEKADALAAPPTIDPTNANDAYLLRQRQRFEEQRRARGARPEGVQL